ncbi:MAG: hypothetical protein R6W96_03925 [Clostridia bacterium]
MKRFLAVFLVVAMVAALCGCSLRAGIGDRVDDGSKPEDPGSSVNGGEVAGPGESESIGKAFHNTASAYELARLFKELHYTYKSTDSDDQTKETKYELKVLDEKTVDGKPAFSVHFKYSDGSKQGEMIALINEKDVLEATINGEKYEGDYNYAFVTLQSYMMPFVPQVMWSEVLTKTQMQTVLRWNLKNEDRKAANLGGGTLTIATAEYEVANETMYFEMTNVGNKSVFVYTRQTDDEKLYEFAITRMIKK